MFMRKILMVCLLFWVQNAYPLAVETSAEVVLLMNADTGSVLYEKNARKKIYPASLTKVATALYTLDEKQGLLANEIRVSKEALKTQHSSLKKQNNYEDPPYWLEDNVVLLWVHTGLKISLKELLFGMMLRSANDAANALAEGVSGTVPEFMNAVNTYLKKIGCEETYFLNPHGIHHPKHFSTAYDLAKMFRKGLKNPAFVELIGCLSFTPPTKFGPTRTWLQVNRLMNEGKYFYPFSLGGKTGYHSSSGYHLVAAAEKEGRRLIGVVIGTNDAEQRYKEMIQLFDAAFEEKKVQKTCFSSLQLFTRKLDGDNTLKARLKHDISLEYFPSEAPQNVKAFAVFEKTVPPIEQGEEVGQVRLFSGEELLDSKPLYSCEKIEDSFWLRMKRRFSSLMK